MITYTALGMRAFDFQFLDLLKAHCLTVLKSFLGRNACFVRLNRLQLDSSVVNLLSIEVLLANMLHSFAHLKVLF